MCSTEPMFAATRWSALGKLSRGPQDRRGGCLQDRTPDSVARRSRMRVEPSQIVEHRNKRRAGATAETAAACLHFRRTSRNHDINVIRNASGDSSAAVRRRAMNAIELERRYSAHNYAPLPVVLTRGKGAHLWDTAGRRYVDMMSAYSTAGEDHCQPQLPGGLLGQVLLQDKAGADRRIR